MIRIKTTFGNAKVSTLSSFGKWYTFVYLNDKLVSTNEAANLLEAGENHLRVAYSLKGKT